MYGSGSCGQGATTAIAVDTTYNTAAVSLAAPQTIDVQATGGAANDVIQVSLMVRADTL